MTETRRGEGLRGFSLLGWGSVVKNMPANAGDAGIPWVRNILWKRKWQPAPVFLPEKSHGQRLVGYSPWSLKESDVTE